MKSISFDFVPKGKQKSDKMLFINLLPDISCGGRTNELDITAEIIRYILYTLLYIRIHLTNYVSY